MAKRKEYEGGAWAIGGIRSSRPAVSPGVRRGLLVDRYIPHCQRRIDAGAGKVYGPLLAEYRRELLGLSVQMAQERATARRGAAVAVEKVAV